MKKDHVALVLFIIIILLMVLSSCASRKTIYVENFDYDFEKPFDCCERFDCWGL
jgi:hypothetical protein